MIEIAVGNLESVTGAKLVAGNAERICRGVEIDSRQVGQDALFVAFPGERVDGNDFVGSALSAGAGACLMTREPSQEIVELAESQGAAILVAEDPTAFLLKLAHSYRNSLGAVVVGITGSIGKTTTKDTLAAMLAKRFRVHATRGNFNNLIGLPLTVLSAPADTEVLVLEMGMNSFGEIEQLSRCAQPHYAVITKVGTSHIGMLGGREGIARAKAEILTGMHASSEAFEGHASAIVLNGEDDFTSFIIDTFAKPAGIDVVLAGTSEADAVRASNIQVGEDGCPVFDITYEDGQSFTTKLSIPGAQSVPNALYAATIAHRLGVTPAEIADACAGLTITGHRQEIKTAACGARVIDDSYNASPESMAAGLDLLARLSCSGRRIAVLGEMGELGSEAPRLHGLTGAYAAAKKLAQVVCVGGEDAEAMAAAARLMGMAEDAVVCLPTCEDALAYLKDSLGPSDLVLVKGSHSVGLDRFVEGVC